MNALISPRPRRTGRRRTVRILPIPCFSCT